ncbi:single-stranded DNA-binding protein (plasmid) [Citricoccus nitrophenolicus]
MLYPLAFTGRLGGDIEVKPDKHNKSYANVSIACENGKKGEDYYKLVWVPLSLNGRLADNAAATLKKGMLVEVIAKVDSYSIEVTRNGKDMDLSQITFRVTSIAPSLAFATAEVTPNPFDDDNAGSGQRRSEQRTESRPEPAPAKPEPAKASAGGGFGDDF